MLLLTVYLRGKQSPTSHYEVIALNIVLGTIFTPLKKQTRKMSLFDHNGDCSVEGRERASRRLKTSPKSDGKQLKRRHGMQSVVFALAHGD